MRTNNEDSYLVLPPWREPALSRKVCFYAVADGMGGHANGEVASRLAVDVLRDWVKGLTNAEMSLQLIEAAYAEANAAIWKASSENSEQHGMGTTLTSVLVSGNQALFGHVGDTRAYLRRGDELRQITKDHTLVAEQVRMGHLTAEQAKTHPARHILSRALGVREFVPVDTVLLELVPNDIILLCSDGIYGTVSDEILKATLNERPFPRIGKLLTGEAKKAGGPDNATAVVFKIDEVPVSFPSPLSFHRFHKLWKDWWDGF